MGGSPSTWNNEIPLYYKAQVAHYAMIINCERVDVPVLFDRWQYACFPYYRDPEFEDQVLEACLTFWNEHVVKKNPPNPINLHDIQSLYPIPEQTRLEATACQATEGIQRDLQELCSILQTKKKLLEREETIKIPIMDYMKNHETLLDGENILATWKGQKRSILDTDRLKTEHPALYRQYKKDQMTRVFRLNRLV